MYAVECEHLSCDIGDRRVLYDINFSLRQGEYLSIIGPNGSGKSTLLKSIIALLGIGEQKGRISLNGCDISKITRKDIAKSVAYIPQDSLKMPPFTVWEFASFSRYPYCQQNQLNDRDNFAIYHAFELTNTLEFVDKPITYLSSGERQRVYLAAAIAQGTRILLLDEPTSFLDPKHATIVSSILRKLCKNDGYTVLHVTHDLTHLLLVEGKVLVLRSGVQIFFGDTSEITKNNGEILTTCFEHKFLFVKNPEDVSTMLIVPSGLE